jgi:hypothetical protein
MRFTALAAALLLGGCATTYELSVMPRDSGKIYTGTAANASGAEGPMSITIEDKTYNGTWVQTAPATTTGFVSSFGLGWGWRRGGLGTMVTLDNPQGGEAKALLSAADGSGLRCDFRSGPSLRGGGVCRDDRGREYDVQIRPAPRG